MTKKQVKIRERMLFTLLMLAGSVFLFAPSGLTNKLQFAFVRVFHGPLSTCRNFTLAVGKQQSLATVVDQSKYIRLRNHLANNIQWLRHEHQKVEMLSKLRNKYIWKGVDFVLADVITASMYDSQSEFIINRGKDDGLTRGQFVMGNHSIIGTISNLDSHTAKVRLITDPASKIVVKIAELNANNIMQGNADNSAKVLLLPTKHEVKINDIVYAQKKPGFLETPIIAGTVAQCKTADENPLIWDITVKPACDIQKLKSVTVIITKTQKRNQTENDKSTAKALSGQLKINNEELR